MQSQEYQSLVTEFQEYFWLSVSRFLGDLNPKKCVSIYLENDFEGLVLRLLAPILHLPLLSSLTVKGFMFYPGSDLMDCITRHGGSLTKLILDDSCVCSDISHAKANPAWADIYRELEQHMKCLQEFSAFN